MNRKTRKILREARATIADEERWTRTMNARGWHGNAVPPTSSLACQWCIRGAVLRACGMDFGIEPSSDSFWAAWRLLQAEAGTRSPTEVNDSEGHAAALALLDRAIAR